MLVAFLEGDGFTCTNMSSGIIKYPPARGVVCLHLALSRDGFSLCLLGFCHRVPNCRQFLYSCGRFSIFVAY